MATAVRVLICVFYVCSVVATGIAQPVAATDRVMIGVYGHYVSATHTAGFRQLPGYGLPPGTSPFADGSGGGGGGGLMLDIPFTSFFRASSNLSRVRLGIRTGYLHYDGTIAAEEPATVLRKNGSPVEGAVTHTLSSSTSFAVFESTIGFVPFGGLQVFMGGQFSIPLAATFVQTQAVSRPLGADFADPDARTMEIQGDIPQVVSPAIAVTVGASQAFALDRRKRLLFVPEVLLSIPLTDMAQDVDWQVSSVRMGVSLLYTPEDIAVPRFDTLLVRDTVTRTAAVEHERVYFAEVSSRVRAGRNGTVDTLLVSESYVREVPANTMPAPPLPSLSAVAVWDGVPAGDTVVLEERVVLTAVPLLGYVFFDSASAELPARYTRLSESQADGFSSADLHSATGLEVYRNILNITGERLRRSRRATITLTGCNDGMGERAGTLSEGRARTIRDYLVDVWRIDPARIRIRSRDLPAMPSNSAVREGAEENRRVEITFSDAALAGPLWTGDTALVMQTEKVLIYPRVEGTFTRWQVAVGSETSPLFSAKGISASDTLEWRPDAVALASVSGGIGLQLTAYAGTGEYPVRTELPLRRLTAAGKRAAEGDRETERYSLLLFPFDGATLSAEQRTLLRSLAAKLSPENKITVIGTTDEIGDEEYNMRLSLQRARAVADVLKRPDATVIGAGEDTRTFPGNVPEGRFYSRTVRIEVERIVRE